MVAKAWLVVRAVVPNEADRAAFDAWYGREHLPDAMRAFQVARAWRGWSQQDPSVHCAYYQFASLDALKAITEGPVIQALIVEFDRCWHGKVTRTREVFSVADEVGL